MRIRCSASVIVTLLALGVMTASPLWAQEKPGFQDIPFGTTYSEVKKVLQKNIKANKYGKGVEVLSGEGYLWMRWFKLGDESVEVTFSFDHKKRFYCFIFGTQQVSAPKFDSDVREAGEYLTEVFKRRYGAPAKCSKVGFLDVAANGSGALCTWNNSVLDIYTGLSGYESKFHAIAGVALWSLEREYFAHNNQVKAAGTAKGARQF